MFYTETGNLFIVILHHQLYVDPQQQIMRHFSASLFVCFSSLVVTQARKEIAVCEHYSSRLQLDLMCHK